MHLYNWEFISFVEGDFDLADTRKQILMLVRDLETEEINLAIFFIDPWKNIDRDNPFDVPEHVFVVSNSNIILPEDKSCPNMYSYDKIRSVFILPTVNYKVITLII